MNTAKKLLISLVTIAALPAFADTNTATVDVPTMHCSVCPITVKKALSGVSGVSKVEVNFDKKEATVTFDDAKTSVNTLIKATTDAGYPSKVKTEVKN
jgi:periplasmic mercuric ion binding protein